MKSQSTRKAGFTKLQRRTPGMVVHSSNHAETTGAGFAWK